MASRNAEKAPAARGDVAPPQQKGKKKELYPMVNWKYDTFLHAMGNLVDLFFREVVPRGSWKVPQSGPVLFVAGPHANQVRGANPPMRSSPKKRPVCIGIGPLCGHTMD